MREQAPQSGDCTLAERQPLLIRSWARPPGNHPTTFAKTGYTHQAQSAGTTRLPGTNPPRHSSPSPVPPSEGEVTHTVAGWPPPSAERPTHTKGLASPGLSTERPSRTPGAAISPEACRAFHVLRNDGRDGHAPARIHSAPDDATSHACRSLQPHVDKSSDAANSWLGRRGV